MHVNRIKDFLPPDDEGEPEKEPWDGPAYREPEGEVPTSDSGCGSGEAPCHGCPSMYAWGGMVNRLVVGRHTLKDGQPIIVLEIHDDGKVSSYGLMASQAAHVATSIDMLLEGYAANLRPCQGEDSEEAEGDGEGG